MSRVDPRRQRTVVVRELLIALAVRTLFLFAGRYLLELLCISEPALIERLMGMVLVSVAIQMLMTGVAVFVASEPAGGGDR
jgi:multiple antibiotic resistance protein